MRRLFSPLVALTMISLALVAVPSARAADPVPAAAAVYTPAAGTTFNRPRGTVDEQLVIMNQLVNSANSAPAGSTIRVAVYSFSYTPFADALIAAFRRGVIVKIIIDDHANPRTPENRRLRRVLNASTKDASWVDTCKYGCMSSKPSFMHAKLYQFSRSGNAKYVTMIASANPAYGAADSSWNNNYTMVGDTATYNSNKKYFNDMKKDKTNTGYYRTSSSGPVKSYFFPRAGTTSTSDNFYLMLDQVTCRGASPGYGTADGRTIIRVTAYRWTSLRTNIASKLADLQSKGCDVQVIYASDTTEAPVPKILLGKKIPVYDSRIDVNGDRVPDLYVHSKYVLINGFVAADTHAKLVYTGSPNFTRNSLRQSNEILLRIDRDDVYEKFAANFAEIRDNWTKRVTKVPKASSQVAARNGRPESDPRADDYALDPHEDE